jgi:hypothetical protein
VQVSGSFGRGGVVVTEAEWLTCTDPTPMMEFLRGKASRRKMRLFGSVCCRRVWENLTDPKARRALELAERAVEGSDIPRQLRRAATNLWDILHRLERAHGEFGYLSDPQALPTKAVLCLVESSGGPTAANYIESIPRQLIQFVRESTISIYEERDVLSEQTALSHLLRDLFGTPQRPVTADPGWLTSTAVSIASGIYADRAFDRLPILADALQDAGCEENTVLDHCRGEGLHARGCWAVDLLLGKQ